MDTLSVRAMDNVERIRYELRFCEGHADNIVQVRCSDQAEAERLDRQLTDFEKARVRFTWPR